MVDSRPQERTYQVQWITGCTSRTGGCPLTKSRCADAAVVGITVHDEELPRAYVVLKDCEGANAASLPWRIKNFVSQRVAKLKQLSDGVHFISEVPRLASGKIVRKVLKEWAKQDARVVENGDKAKL
jgi:4-coumarate--CoA ligase